MSNAKKSIVRAGLTVIVMTALISVFLLTRPSGKNVQRSSGSGSMSTEDSVVEDTPLPIVSRERGFVSSNSCGECHEDEHSSWHDSFHRTMTQVANSESVVGEFDGRQLTDRGRNFSVRQRDGRYFVSLPNPDLEHLAVNNGLDLSQIRNIPDVEREVLMTTGSHHYQGYWIGGNKQSVLRQFPFVYHIGDQQWVPRSDVLLEPPDQPMTFPVWNNSCIDCHTVAGRPGFNENEQVFTSQVAELGIACEACHGPGEKHVDWHRKTRGQVAADSVSGKVSPPPEAVLVNPARLSHQRSTQVCGRCHTAMLMQDSRESDWIVDGDKFIPGEDLESSHRVMRMDSGLPGAKDYFWGDGACNTGGREYLGLTESECFKKGKASCLSCHSMHRYENNDGQMKAGLKPNQACLQCHEQIGSDLSAHTHHGPASSGSECYNCHMPHSAFALLTAVRAHRIDSPDVSASLKHGKPNACNLCHIDQTLSWTAEYLEQWYSIQSPSIDAKSDEATVPASILWSLKGDALQRSIAAWHLGWQPAVDAAGKNWQVNVLARLFTDDYPVVRYVASHAVSRLTGEKSEFNYVADEAERIVFRDKLLSAWKSQHVSQTTGALRIVSDELLTRLIEQQDKRPVVHAE